LLEPVLPGSVTFESSILAPLHNSYLYEESKESFTYNSAQLINNAALQKRYSAFRAEKREHGYSEEELEESFGFLLLDDKSRANRLAETGLIVGKGTCTTLGDCSKGLYISKYSDCLDLKRWYDGKTGYIVLLKLTKYYMYELVDGVEKVEPCPRHVCPFAIVAFSYGKAGIALELKEKRPLISAFYYQPWSGQLQIKSAVFNIGLKSNHGAMFPANLPKTVKADHAIEVSKLRKTLPQAVFETSPVSEVFLDGKWFSMYDVISFEARNDIAFLTQELKEKDLAIVICLEDGGFLVLLHSSNFLSYEGAGTDKAFALQGMFIYPDSRTVPRETKTGCNKTKISSEVLQVLPALNYAELEMEKCPPKQDEEPLGIMEKHLQNFAALIFPGLTSSPSREASMFPDQYDVPDGFPLIAPKWTEQTGNCLRTYLKSPSSFHIPLARAMELLAAGKQQRSDDHDDDVYYYISSPEAPQTPTDMVMERDLPNETDHLTCRNVSEDVKKTAEQQAETEQTVAAEQSVLIEEVNTPGAVVVAVPDNNPAERTDLSPTSGDLSKEHYTQNIQAVDTAQDSKKTSECASANDKCSGEEVSGALLKETIQTNIVALSSTEIGDDASTLASNAEMEVDHSDKVNCVSDMLPKVGGQIPVAEKLQEADLPTSISPPTTSVNRTEALIKGCKDIQPETSSNVPAKYKPGRRGKRRRRKALKRNTNTAQKALECRYWYEADIEEKRNSKIPKENACNNFDNISTKELVKQADRQLTTIVEKEGSIQVTRHWKENYDFKFDSKFTNDKLDKCVTRALHGKWDFSIEDGYEQVHLIFHMWIGLFYSKPTSRFFHFDQMCPSVEKKNPEKASKCAVETSTSLPDVDLTSKEDNSTSLDPVSDALDLSVKVPETEDHLTTGENPTPTSDIRSRLEHMRESKMEAIRHNLNYSPSVPPGSIPMLKVTYIIDFFFFFRLLPSGVATANHLSPPIPIFCILNPCTH
ncbi:hypothetical protein QTP70_031004, partial [Hemibagrus guttatus]